MRYNLATILITSFLALGCRTPNNSSDTAGLGKKKQPSYAAKSIENQSTLYRVSENDVDLFATYSGRNRKSGERKTKPEIEIEMLRMIANANHKIILSTFLFDCMYASPGPDGKPLSTKLSIPQDLVKKLDLPSSQMTVTESVLEALISKKRQMGRRIKIAVILDPLNRSYLDRVSPAEAKLAISGIDVFYSDLLQTPSALKGAASAFQRYHEYQAGKRLLPNTTGMYARGLLPIAERVAKHLPFSSPLDDISIKNGDVFSGSSTKPEDLNGAPVTVDTLVHAGLAKANHRKILVTDTGTIDNYAAMVASQNPHNASFPSANTSIVARGKVAKFIHNSILLDINHSIWRAERLINNKSLYPRYVRWSKQRIAGKKNRDAAKEFKREFVAFPNSELKADSKDSGNVRVSFVTESKVKDAIMGMIKRAKPDSEVRIQMFYLSEPEVIDAIISLAAQKYRKKPVRLLLDPNKDAFNKLKKGTPNRQVAYYMLQKAKFMGLNPDMSGNKGKLQIRWYATTGEQNHAKIMTVSGPSQFEVTTGSSNWTTRNITGPNMESNYIVIGSSKMNNKFDKIFDELWRCGYKEDSSTCPIHYSWSWKPEAYSQENEESKLLSYHIPDEKPEDIPVTPQHFGKWLKGEETGFCSW